MKPRVRETIAVEGRYDKNTLSQVVEANIVELGGFAVFNDREKVDLLRRLAEENGLIVLTDSDGAGFVIRNMLRGAIPEGMVRHAYIPDIYGKERRKRTASREGKLGVEGMTPEVLMKALRDAGATFDGETSSPRGDITKTDLFHLGLSGGKESDRKRRELKKALSLPERLSANALLDVLNALYTREELFNIVRELFNSEQS